MKKVSYCIICITLVLLAVASCKKADQAAKPTSTSTHKPYKEDGISVVNGVMIFPDQKTLQNTVQNLDAQQQSALIAFDGTLPPNLIDSTSDSIIKLMAKEQGFDENQTFINFESTYGFHSMRMDFEAAVITWAANGLNDADPNNPFVYYSNANYPFLSVVNPAGAVGVGSELYKIMRNGVVYEITDGSFTTLNNITDANMDVQYKASDVVIHNPQLLGTRNGYGSTKKLVGCTGGTANYVNYGPGSPHLQDIISIHDYYIFSVIDAEGINWVHHWNGWQRDWAQIRSGYSDDKGDPCNSNQLPSQDCGYLWTNYHSCHGYYGSGLQVMLLHTNTYIYGGAWGHNSSNPFFFQTYI